jgi:hypothetical protein
VSVSLSVAESIVPVSPAPDIVLLGAEWQPRALMRAQLIEEGFEVLAADTWPMMRRHLRPGAKPTLAIVDLKGLPTPQDVLRDLRVLMPPNRVLVLTALATARASDIERLGFRTLSRPIVIKDIVDAAVAAMMNGPRVSREFPVNERLRLELMLDLFNLFDRVNVKDINTVWGSTDYPGTPPPATLGFGTPRDVFNPRQVQFGAKVKF